MSESAYKPTEIYEDELDQLAQSVRDELRTAGFAPAFDPEAEDVTNARLVEQAQRSRGAAKRRLLLGYIVPALAILALGIAVRLLMPLI